MAARAPRRSSSKSPKHPAEILVICSNVTDPEGDYKLPATQTMIKRLFPNGVTPTCLS